VFNDGNRSKGGITIRFAERAFFFAEFGVMGRKTGRGLR